MAPAHSTLSVLGEASKDFVVISSYIVIYGYHCAVNECYTRTLAEGIELHEQHHLKEQSWHEFNEEGVSKCTHPLFYAQSPDFLKPGLCYFLKFLYL